MNVFRNVMLKPKINNKPQKFIMSYSVSIFGIGSYACFDIFNKKDILDTQDIMVVLSLTKIE